MRTLLRNLLALLAGAFVGGAVNMAIIMISPTLIPPPAGVDVTNTESLARGIDLFGPQHFVMPFLAHALGTLAGSLVAWLIAATHKSAIAYAIGVLFLAGGISASFMIPAPVWFIALDLIVAYLPMSWLAIRIGERMTRGSAMPRAAAAG